MKKGLFFNIVIILNIVCKISKKSNIKTEELMQSTNPESIRSYYNEIVKRKIKVAKLYFCLDIFGKLIIVQKRIRGLTLEKLLQNSKISLEYKFKIMDKLWDIYLKMLNSDYILDWNFKNFIIYNDELVYVDLNPVLIKNEIKLIKSDNLQEIKKGYLDDNLRIAGIIGYSLGYLLDFDRQILKDFFKHLEKNIKNKFNITYNELLKIKNEHIYIKKLRVIKEYIDYGDIENTKKNLKMLSVRKYTLGENDG